MGKMRGDRSYHRKKTKPYNTRSNRIKPVKTPGANISAHSVKKKGIIRRCSTCKQKLEGIKKLRPSQMGRARKNDKTVSRVFGGEKCPKCTERIIIRCFEG